MRDGAPTRRNLLLAAAGAALVGAVAPARALAQGEGFDVSYGVGPNLAALRAQHGQVARLLGEGVARELVIVRLAADRYALVYRRGGDLASTRAAAARHARLLARHGLDATAIASRGAVVYPTSRAEHVVANAPSAADQVAAPAAPAPAEAPSQAPASDDPALEAAIEAAVKDLRRRGRVAADERTSWLVYDLEGDRPLATVNAEVPRQAASMIKPLVMLAFFHEVRRGRFIYGSGSRGRLEAMIQRSSNVSTNWAIDQIGGPAAVQRILSSAYGELVPNARVVERIGPGGRTYRNRAAVADYGRYLRALWRDELPHAKEQRRILGLPNRDRIYHGAPSIPPGTVVLDKTGSTSRCCGDMGIVVARRKGGGVFPYVFCGVIEKASRASSYGSWVSARGDVIRQVSDLCYRELAPRYGLV